ncbi:MAG: hypothetical protein HKN04_01495 [Rhodothermaceae bacterium]|nr:hypothetical protein [Rhodothermaceae bacterium]
MGTKRDKAETEVDTRPWRKRHPVLSRFVLYPLGLGLAVLLVVLLMERQDDDTATELRALQQQLDGLSLILVADPSGDEVLRILDDKFDRDDLPVRTQGRALRWRALAWRRKLNLAADAKDEAGKRTAIAALDKAHAAAAALDLEPAERYSLALERAEALLEQQRVDEGIAALPPADQAPTPTHDLLRAFTYAQGVRLQDDLETGLGLLRARLGALDAPLEATPVGYVGGREWSRAQVAVELANFVTKEGKRPADSDLWLRLRRLAPKNFDLQVAAALGLLTLSHPDEALRAWERARVLNGRLAQAALRKNNELAPLEERLRQP